MWTRVILIHPYFPQTVHRFRHICYRAHAILGILKLRVGDWVGVVWNYSIGLFWTRYRVFYCLLRAGVENWVKIRPLKHTVSKWSMMKSVLQVSKTICYASLRREI